MRKLVLFVTVVMMSLSTFANNEIPVKDEIRTKIVKLLGKVNFTIKEEVKTTVDFLINKKGEVVILEIDCASPEVCSYIKSKLNYKKVYKKLNTSLKVYKMPLTIVKN
ncbi:conserved exported hypothetical protein [Tenacibaculum sp. 190524A02b]|uniref:Uncharacterized protein n=1 Tax=Tenacibaculum vairaonense TaxID=3137860 RepID=A0ABP1F9P2_9FLAO